MNARPVIAFRSVALIGLLLLAMLFPNLPQFARSINKASRLFTRVP